MFVFGIGCLLQISDVDAVQYAIESDIAARTEYNDNIFLTSQPHDSVYLLSIIPSAKMVMREKHWEAFLNGTLRSNNYSESNLDNDNIYLDTSGSYTMERNIYSLTGQYNKVANITAESTDFGVTGELINRKLWSIVPQYQRLLTERLVFSTSFNHTDVEYIDAEDTGYVSYNTDVLSASIVYDLAENDKINFILQATDYLSKDEAFEYQLFITQLGVEHNFSELWSVSLSVGGSRKNTTNRITQTFDFFGQPITLTEVVNFTDRGYVLDAGFERRMETGAFTGGVSRNFVPNSFGGLNLVDTLQFNYQRKLSSLWRCNINTRYENIEAESIIERSTDREVLFFEPRIFYTIDQHWTAIASYRYIQRKFRSDTSDDRAPHSNRIYIGISYNFPDISTF